MDIAEVVAAFLRRHSKRELPLLLALSGGPDSLALFYSLLRCRIRGLVDLFGVAHVDHGWRETSGAEAAALEALACEQGVPWHGYVLDPTFLEESFAGNLEETCRHQRLAFFEEVCREYGYVAVLLAHHADDQAETVLKRLFEGAHLTALGAMTPVSRYGQLVLWRPLLSLPKRALVQWVGANGWRYIEDATNADIRFLRARMRAMLIPQLAETFGKEIAAPLSQLSLEAREVEEHLMTLCAPALEQVRRGWAGVMVDLASIQPSMPPLPPFAIRHLLRQLLRQCGCGVLSHAQLDAAAHHLLDGAANKRYASASAYLYLDRRRAFVSSQPFTSTTTPIQPQHLSPGVYSWGQWTVTVSPAPSTFHNSMLGWQEAWQGKLSVILPAGDYMLMSPQPHLLYVPTGHSLDSLWSDAKVPAFLRSLAPVVVDVRGVVCEFLSGRLPARLSAQPPPTEQWKLEFRVGPVLSDDENY